MPTDQDRSGDEAARHRIAAVAVVLAVTAVVAVPAGVMWPESSAGGDAYAFGDVEPIRQQWWTVLTLLAVMLPLNVPAQALATMALVRSRGSRWVTWGGVVMWIGASMQAVGITFLAGAYYFATDPDVSRTAADQVFTAIAGDQGHLYGVLFPGAVLVLLGTAAQVVGLFRAHVVPLWIPVALLFIVVTFVVPGNGALGLVTSLPTTAGAIGLGYHAWRSVAREVATGEATRVGAS